MKPHRATIIAEYVLGVLLIVFILGPLAWLAIRAFAGLWTFPNLLPTTWTLRWWGTVFAEPGLVSSIVQSLIIAPVVTLVSAVVCLPAAYALSRYRFPGRQAVLIVIFSTNAFPKFGLFITMASLFYGMRLMGTFVGVLIVQLIGTIVFMVWIPAAAFSGVSRDLQDAARDAGAGPFRVFRSITLPLAAPAIFVALILSFLSAFDEAQGTFLVGAPTYITMPVRMYTLVNNYPPQVAAVFSILLSIPSVLLLLSVRKRVLGGAIAEGFSLH